MLTDIPISLIVLCSGLGLILIGMWGMLTQRNIIRMIIGFSLMDTGIHMVMVSIGYVTGGTAPIINDAVPIADAVNRVVDPVPSALVLTAIVIGLGVTAVMLAFAVRIFKARNTLNIDECTESKW
ncbi:MAG: sodium:proton antiporter [Gammaproteobacteria bacterium]|nr:sodium:proton antiporter [Gammaproteobacteria bacterium]MBT8135313.1 sodium:proton antiporter [Gammaproteobacteria bacterium]NNJ50297.1 cation:proton antiporter [Gammaproteobacteria bacterium]